MPGGKLTDEMYQPRNQLIEFRYRWRPGEAITDFESWSIPYESALLRVARMERAL